MTPHRWTRIEQIFEMASALPRPEVRSFLDAECGDDRDLHDEVLALLDADTDAGAYLDSLGEAVVVPAMAAAMKARDVLIGKRVGPYRVEEVIGHGGMGTVYRAVRADGAFEQTVALKVLRIDLPGHHAARILSERRILARFEHAGIARLLDGGITVDGRPWLAMEFVEGLPVTVYARHHGLGLEERLHLFLKICDAVSYAHARLTVHRDLKPSNILVGEEAQVKLLDFGIAKLIEGNLAEQSLTRGNASLFTPEYAAPEQFEGTDVTVATDVYSLGVLLFELLAGRRPFLVDGSKRRAVEEAVLYTDPPRPSTVVREQPSVRATNSGASTRRRREGRRLRGDLDLIVLKALRKEPDRRYASVASLAADIRRHLSGMPVKARPDTLGYRVKKFVGRNLVGVVATAAITMALFTGLGTALWQAQRAEAEAQRAQRAAAKAELITEFVIGLFQVADPTVVPGAYVQSYASLDVSAQAVLERGVMRSEALLDEPDVQADLLTVIANTMQGVGAAESARAPAERAVEIRRDLLARGSPDVTPAELASSLETLANVYFRTGDVETSVVLFDEALSLLGDDGDNTALVTHVLLRQGNAYATLAQNEAAEDRFYTAMDRARRAGLDVQVIEAHYQLGALYRHRGDLDEAQSILQAGLQAATTSTHDTRIQRSAIRSYIGIVAVEQRRYAEAEANLLQGYRELAQNLPAEHPLVMRAQVHLGALYFHTARYDEAHHHLRPAYDWRRQHLGPDNIATAEAAAWLGAVYAMWGQMAEAEHLMLESYHVFASHRGSLDRYVQELHDGVLTIYRMWGKPERAQDFLDATRAS